MRSLRSLLVEIHPPDLRAHGLAAALEDLTAPAASAGIAVTAARCGVAEVAQDATVALVWRVAQEAVRNAIRHAAATSLTVRVDGDEHVVTLGRRGRRRRASTRRPSATRRGSVCAG